ncbi:MAG: nuclear transport factor 2 family protein [Thermoproteota archaeon]|nr:nuclear transport factor 2 family protein [Thermoproteota archaeon]
MQKDNGIALEEVNQANIRFYHAFESLSIDLMDKAWKHDENVVCIHPGWDLFTGWLAIRESWIAIFSNTERIRFTITNTKIKIFDNKIAVVVCIENIETKDPASDRVIRMGVIATNLFEGNGPNGQWSLIHHHGSPVTDYMPPNTSSS